MATPDDNWTPPPEDTLMSKVAPANPLYKQGDWAPPNSDVIAERTYQANKQLTRVPSVNRDESFWGNVATGAKHSIQDAGTAVRQWANTISASQLPDVSDTLTQQAQSHQSDQQKAADEANAALKTQQSGIEAQRASTSPQTLTGKAGNLVGSSIPSLAMSAIAPEGVLGQAAAGAASGLLSPSSDTNSTAGNVAAGAIGGGIGGGLGKLLGSVGFTNVLTDRANTLVDLLKSKGVPVDLAQSTGSKLAQDIKNLAKDSPLATGNPTAEQIQAFTQAVMQRMGGSETDATPTALSRESDRIGSAKAAVYQRMGTVPVDQSFVWDLAKINTDDITNEATRGMVNDKINELTRALRPGPNGTFVLNPDQLQNAKMDLDNWVLGPDPILKRMGTEIQETLDGAVERNAPPGASQTLKELNRQTRVLLQTAKAAQPDGTVPPNAFWNAIKAPSNWRTAKMASTGDQGTAELARAGSAILKDGVGNSGTARRIASQALIPTIGAAVGGQQGYEHGGAAGASAGAGSGALIAKFGAPMVAKYLAHDPQATAFIEKYLTASSKNRGLLQNVGGRLGGALGADASQP